ncbi:MAG TPA: class I SAM-dependent methyltransferase [Bryobacteraceae bacterium]|jgi:SAM-dependent methyltransferase
MNSHLDFGYPWWLTYGHLPILAGALLMLLVGYARNWPKWPMLLLAVLLLWSSAAFMVMRFGLNANGRASLPTQNFFPSGAGRVLDIGAGTGRSSIMVLEARPRAALVALDLFADSFDQHFGSGGSPQARLLGNLKAAGVERRATIETADMHRLPFPPASFDAIVSAYAIDHLSRQGSAQALAEAARVLKPGGDFLLMVIAKERWAKLAFGPLLMHGGVRGPDWWDAQMGQVGFKIVEQGTRPGTLYILARKQSGKE